MSDTEEQIAEQLDVVGAYGAATCLEAEGAHIALVPCLVCGAVVMLDPRDPKPYATIHAETHNLAAKKEEGSGG